MFIRFPFVFTRVHSCSIRVHSCSFVFTRVHSCSFVFHSCSTRVDSCSFVFHSCSFVFTRVHSCSFVFIRVHSCSFVFRSVWCFRYDRNNPRYFKFASGLLNKLSVSVTPYREHYDLNIRWLLCFKGTNLVHALNASVTQFKICQNSSSA